MPPVTRDSELEKFKDINLTEYARHRGYEVVRQETSRNSVAMKNAATGHKIIIARASDLHWIYFTVGDTRDNGSIIDFVMKRDGVSLGRARPILRDWLSLPPSARPKPEEYVKAEQVTPSSPDRQAIIGKLCALPAVSDHPYLRSRAVGPGVLADPRFAGRVLLDPEKGAAIFPHEDEQGICGMEERNHRFKGFSAKGTKGLWRSNITREDTRLVFCESAIDALSYHALHPDPRTRYMSCAGGWSETTRTLMRRAAGRHPGSDIVLAFDRDAQGRKYEADARALLATVPGKTISAHFPPEEGKDWNDVLMAKAGLHRPTAVQHSERRPSEGYAR